MMTGSAKQVAIIEASVLNHTERERLRVSLPRFALKWMFSKWRAPLDLSVCMAVSTKLIKKEGRAGAPPICTYSINIS